MKKLAALLALSLTLTAVSKAANADLGIAGNTNAFIFGTANTSGGHSDGSVVVLGSWTGNNYEVRQKATVDNVSTAIGSPTTSETSVYVGGNNSLTGFLRTSTGKADIVGTKGTLSQNGANNTYYSQAYDFAPTVANLKKLSSDLFALPGTSLITASNLNGNDIKVNLSLTSGDLKVYTVSGSQLSILRNLSFQNTTGNETIVINVTGNVTDWGWNQNTDTLASKIIWNFDSAVTSVNVNNKVNGTILATNATVTQGNAGLIQGTLIAQNWVNSGSAELHVKKFTGTIPLVSAPEPAGVMTMAGFLGLALCSRRRQAVRL
jgi:choice-of-anchor A domain-containing protein